MPRGFNKATASVDASNKALAIWLFSRPVTPIGSLSSTSGAGFPAVSSAARWYEDYERAVELIDDSLDLVQCAREPRGKTIGE